VLLLIMAVQCFGSFVALTIAVVKIFSLVERIVFCKVSIPHMIDHLIKEDKDACSITEQQCATSVVAEVSEQLRHSNRSHQAYRASQLLLSQVVAYLGAYGPMW
jgi:hypothetical protein